MFDEQINQINNFYRQRLKSLGRFISLEQLNNIALHPALLKYINAEVDFLIFEDRNKLLKNSAFDYSGEKTLYYFSLISDEIKKNKKFTFEFISKLINHAVAFNVHYLCRPNWTLAKFIFEDSSNKTTEELAYLLNYAYFYPLLTRVLIKYFKKKKIGSIDVNDFNELLRKIDGIAVEDGKDSIVKNAINSMNEFLGMDGGNPKPIVVKMLKYFLMEKGLTRYYDLLASNFPDEETTVSEEELLTLFELKAEHWDKAEITGEEAQEEVETSDIIENEKLYETKEKSEEEISVPDEEPEVAEKEIVESANIEKEEPVELPDAPAGHSEFPLTEKELQASGDIEPMDLGGEDKKERSYDDYETNNFETNELPEGENIVTEETSPDVGEDSEKISVLIESESGNETGAVIKEEPAEGNSDDLKDETAKGDITENKEETITEGFKTTENIEENNYEGKAIDDSVSEVTEDTEEPEKEMPEVEEKIYEEPVTEKLEEDESEQQEINDELEELEIIEEEITDEEITLENIEEEEIEENENNDEIKADSNDKIPVTEEEEIPSLFPEDSESKGEEDKDELPEVESEIGMDENTVTDEAEVEKEESKDTRPTNYGIDLTRLLQNKNTAKVIEEIFDYDMEEFSLAIDIISEAGNEEEAMEKLKEVFEKYNIEAASREGQLFKKIISDYFKSN